MTDELVDLLRKTVFQLVILSEDRWDNDIHYRVYDNESYERVDVTKEEFEALKKLRDGD